MKFRRTTRGGNALCTHEDRAVCDSGITRTDAVIIDPDAHEFYFATPAGGDMSTLCAIGGHMRNGEPLAQSMVRCFRKAAGLDLPPERFEFFGLQAGNYAYARYQRPRRKHFNMLTHLFAVRLTRSERSSVHHGLDLETYCGRGLRSFVLDDLPPEAVQMFCKLHDRLFPRMPATQLAANAARPANPVDTSMSPGR